MVPGKALTLKLIEEGLEEDQDNQTLLICLSGFSFILFFISSLSLRPYVSVEQ